MALKLLKDDDEFTVKDTDLVANGDPETSYGLRHITLDKHREFVKQRTKQVPNRRTHQFDKDIDWDAVSDDVFDYVLTSWTGITDEGAAVPCEWEYKKRLDGVRRIAIMEKAGMNEIQQIREHRADSFRPFAAVR